MKATWIPSGDTIRSAVVWIVGLEIACFLASGVHLIASLIVAYIALCGGGDRVDLMVYVLFFPGLILEKTGRLEDPGLVFLIFSNVCWVAIIVLFGVLCIRLWSWAGASKESVTPIPANLCENLPQLSPPCRIEHSDIGNSSKQVTAEIGVVRTIL